MKENKTAPEYLQVYSFNLPTLMEEHPRNKHLKAINCCGNEIGNIYIAALSEDMALKMALAGKAGLCSECFVDNLFIEDKRELKNKDPAGHMLVGVEHLKYFKPTAAVAEAKTGGPKVIPTQTLSIVKWETVSEVEVGAWSFLREHLEPNDDESFTIDDEAMKTLENGASAEDKEEYSELMKALKKLNEENAEVFISIT
jgi:hypothetical protein